MLKIIRFLFGYVSFTVTGSFPERFINLISRRGICLFNIQKNNKTCSACALYSEYKTILSIAEKSCMKIKLTKQTGLPFILKKYKKRFGIPIGMVCFFLIIHFLSLYIWNIDIYGNNKIEQDEIVSLLSELNIKSGTIKNKINTNFLENSIMGRFSNISWVSANIIGSNIEIEIKEQATPPELAIDDTPCNIVAKCDGYITRMEVYSGTPEVKCGDAVISNQLLVSGFEDGATSNTFQHAKAKIFATTIKTFTEYVNLSTYKEIESGKTIDRKRLNIFNLKIPISLRPAPKGNYTRSVETKMLKIGKNSLPISIYKEHWAEHKQEYVVLSKEDAKKTATESLKSRESIALRDLKIIKKDITENTVDNIYYLTYTYICEEDISAVEPILHE